MKILLRSLVWLAAAIIAAITGVGHGGPQTASAASPSFCTAWFHEAQGHVLTLFPVDGPEVAVSLPDELRKDFRLIAFSPDGRSVYGQSNSGLSASGITKIEFKPPRQSIVRGSVGFGTIWSFTASQKSAKIFVSGIFRSGGVTCGAFEIDPDTETARPLMAGRYPECGGGIGHISADGKSILSKQGNRLRLLDLETGAVHPLAGGVTQGNWSPDGRWIAAWGAGSLILIDATDTSKRRKLGSSDSDVVEWSPDSKSLLISKSQVSCWPTIFGSSLEVVDVETGRRKLIKSSHCRVVDSAIGWLDREAVR